VTSLTNNRFTGPPKAKPFSWSYSRLKNFESCAYKHQQVDILKAIPETENPQMLEGNKVHDILAKAVMGAILPGEYAHYEPWVNKVRGDMSGRFYVENKLALTEGKGPVTFFGNGAWFRGVIDVIRIVETRHGDVGLLVDWKTGKIVEDIVQLALFAAMAFAHYPSLVKVRTEYVWLGHDCTTREDFTPADMPSLWQSLKPRIEALQKAWETGVYQPMPGGLCRKHCEVASCEYHGRGSQTR
jgi:hypothetical protein